MHRLSTYSFGQETSKKKKEKKAMKRWPLRLRKILFGIVKAQAYRKFMLLLVNDYWYLLLSLTYAG